MPGECSSYSKVIESIIFKLFEAKKDLKPILVKLLAVAVLTEHLLKMKPVDSNKELLKDLVQQV